MRETLAKRLDVGFFARPAVEESAREVLLRDGAERRDLTPREEVLRDLTAGEVFAQTLDIDADLSPAREGEEADAARVRDVETQAPARELRRERRLAVLVVSESDPRGRDAQVAAQQVSEHAAPDDVMPTVFLEVKPAGLRALGFVEVAAERLDARRLLFERRAPDVHLVRRQKRERRRGLPTVLLQSHTTVARRTRPAGIDSRRLCGAPARRAETALTPKARTVSTPPLQATVSSIKLASSVPPPFVGSDSGGGGQTLFNEGVEFFLSLG